MAAEAFMQAASASVFTPEDVVAFWASDTHYDPSSSAFQVPQPPLATRVAIFLAGQNINSMVFPKGQNV